MYGEVYSASLVTVHVRFIKYVVLVQDIDPRLVNTAHIESVSVHLFCVT